VTDESMTRRQGWSHHGTITVCVELRPGPILAIPKKSATRKWSVVWPDRAGRLKLCCFGCPSLEDDDDLFVYCPSFADLRDEYSRTLLSDTQSILQDATLSTSI